MDAKSYPIEVVFGGEKQFTVPRFQRGYRWKQDEHWEPLWEELEDMAERLLSGEGVDSYYLGAIVVQPMPARGFRPSEYQVVDGQQRLTTLQVMLAALRDICKEIAFPHQMAVSGLIQNHEVIGNENSNDLFKVWPTDTDREVFRLLLSGDPQQEIDQRWPPLRRARGAVERPGLVRAYTYFRSAINEFARGEVDGVPASQQQSWRRLERLLEVVRQKIWLVSIELSNQDDPMMIFEALNGRSERLLPSDLIKNAVLRSAGTEAERLHDLYWKRFGADFWQGEHKRGRLKRSRLDLFVTDYLQFNTQAEVKTPDLFKHFSKWWKGEMKHDSPEELMGAMVEYAEVYQRLLTADRTADEPASIFCANLRLMDFTLAYPLLLSLLKELPDDGGIAAEDIAGILQDVESYLVRRYVCGLTGKKYNYVFPEILKAIRQTRERGEIVSRRNVRQRMMNFSGETVGWPDNRQFARAWCEDPLYGRMTQGVLKVIFARLAERRRGHYKEPARVFYEQMTIEHLMPRAWRENWAPPLEEGSYRGEPETPEQRRERLIHMIGNLTLLGQPLNSAVRNGPWPRKREEIQKYGMFSLNGDFTGREQWDEQAIIERSKALWSEAAELWPYPAKQNEEYSAPGAWTPPRSTKQVDESPAGDAPTRFQRDTATTTETISPTPASAPVGGNPFRPGASYWAIVEALRALGDGKLHSFDAIVPAARKAMGEGWRAFEEKEKRNEATGKNADERLIDNISVVARPDEAYGGKMRKLGFEVRVKGRERMAGLFKL